MTTGIWMEGVGKANEFNASTSRNNFKVACRIIFSPGDFRRSSRKVHQPLPKKRFSMRWSVQLCALLPWWVTEAGN